MLRIGLTGGIGSGKTTVAKIFEILEVPVYYADEVAKVLMNEDEKLKQQIIYHFGIEAYQNNELNRSHLATIVFNNSEKLALLNSLVHPVTISDAAKWIKKQTALYIIKEAALLFESGANKHLDYVIGVNAPKELRMKRILNRDTSTEVAVKARMDKQMNEEEKLGRCDFIIINDESELLIPQVLKLHEKLSVLARKN